MRRSALILALALGASACGGDGGSAPPEALVPVVASAEDLAAACGSAVDWTAAADDLVAAVDAVLVGDDAAAPLDEIVGTTSAQEAMDGLYETVVFSGCPLTPEPATPAQRADALARAGLASAALDDLTAVVGGAPLKTSAPLWYVSDHLIQSIELADIAAGEASIDTLILGSSVALFGFDPAQLAEATGAPAWNAAIGGLPPVGQPAWSRQIHETIGDVETVVLGLSTFEVFRNCREDIEDGFEEATTRRSAAFAEIGFLDEVTGTERLFGAIPASYDGTYIEDGRARFREGSRGRIQLSDERVVQPAGSVQAIQTDFREPQVCELQLQAIAELVTTWADRDARVVVASLRSAEELIAMHPEGQVAHDVVSADLAELVEAAGGEFLDLTDAVEPSQLRDLTHVTATGRRLVTAALAEYLRGS